MNALGISNMAPTASSIPDPRVIAPVLPTRLEQGTWLKKVTKKERKDINL